MANTFRLNWFRKLINSCSGTRKYQQIDDSHPIASSSDLKKVPRLPEKINSTATRSAKCHKRPIYAMTVRMHSVVRNLNSSNKLRKVTLDPPNKRSRNDLKSRASGIPSSRPIPLEIFAKRSQNQTQMGYPSERDLVVTRNIEKMVREWQARLQSRRRSKTEPAVKGRKSSGMPVKFTKNNNSKMGSLGLEEPFTSQGKHINMDVRLARSSASSRSTDDPSQRNKQDLSQTYRMKIVHFKVKNLKNQRKIPDKENIKKVPITKSKSIGKSKSISKSISKSKPPYPSGSKLVKDEQKRLDILKEEWVQLKGLENASRLREAKQLTKPTGPPEAVPPTDLDLASLIVDPKSFLTMVHVKSKFVSVDFGDNKSKPPDGYPDTSKGDGIGFGESNDGLPKLGPD